ncbi:MAG: sugar-binding transcriptional regulator [Oscillospiraceae bacterium]
MKSYCLNDDNKKEYAEVYQVAHMYYDLGMLQPEIAERMFFSRSKVSRLLKQAREMGIVQITVKKIYDRVEMIEKALCSIFGLKDAVVITNYDEGQTEMLDALTDFAAMYISNLLKGSCTVGITRGSTINKVIGKLSNVNDCRLQLVQLMGSSTNSYQSEESHILVNRMLNHFDGTAYYLNTPLYIDDLYAKNILMQDSSVRSVFQQMDACNIILTGIGMLDPDIDVRPSWHGYMTRRHLQELEEKKAVGSICAQYFNIDGELIQSEWNAKCIVMPLESIGRNRLSIGIAQGKNKEKPILGALRGHHINVLITNVQTATAVISLNEELSSLDGGVVCL